MNERLKLIMTRPKDDSLEAFVSFRESITLKITKNKTVVIKDDLLNDWEKFWEQINTTAGRKVYMSKSPN